MAHFLYFACHFYLCFLGLSTNFVLNLHCHLEMNQPPVASLKPSVQITIALSSSFAFLIGAAMTIAVCVLLRCRRQRQQVSEVNSKP